MRSLFVTLCYASFFGVGLVSPFVITLGYLWVDSFIPQGVAYDLIANMPVSQIMALAAIAAYFLLDRRNPPRPCLLSALLLVFAAWTTVTTFGWAVVPSATEKWNVVVKTLVFAAFIPLAIRSRVQIEAFLQVWLFGFAINFLPVGIKTLVAGGGYGRDLGIHSTECCFALSADSRLAVIALMLVPIALYLQKHTVLLPAKLPTRIMYLAVVVLALASAYGIYERTGVIVAAMLGLLMWLKSKRKVLAGAALVTAVVALFHFAPENWMERMTTMTEYNQESSARHRLDVWAWTYNYVVEHPLGGGFNIYEIDEIGVAPDGTKTGLAYHNDFFEVLGEQGWPGLLIFAALIMTSFVQLRIAARRAKRFRQLAWVPDFATAAQMSLVLQLTGGQFVALGYHPPLYMIFALAISLREYVRRVEAATDPAAAPVRTLGRDWRPIGSEPVGTARNPA